MRVTVGISFLNNEKTLPTAIRSVCAQTLEDWELILLDDGSSDRSLEIARSVRDVRVRVLSDGMNLGHPARMNQINKLASGEYVARMDGDDIMHPERLARQTAFLDENPDCDVVGSPIYIIDSATSITGIRSTEPVDASPRNTLRRGILVQGTAMGRTKWWRRHPYNESSRRAEENDLWCRTCADTRFGKLPIPLYYCRENAKDALTYLRDYLQSGRTLRRIYLKYGPVLVGPRESAALILASFAKCGAYTVVTALGLQRALVARRSARLNHEQRAEANRGLESVMRTPVTGLDGG